MRTYAVIVTLIAMILGWLLYDNFQTSTANEKALQSEIISGKNKADSAHRVSLVYKDSFILSEQARILEREEREEAHKEAVTWRNKFYTEKKWRLGIKTGEEYDSILTALYPH
jgi:hypothetical protein